MCFIEGRHLPRFYQNLAAGCNLIPPLLQGKVPTFPLLAPQQNIYLPEVIAAKRILAILLNEFFEQLFQLFIFQIERIGMRLDNITQGLHQSPIGEGVPNFPNLRQNPVNSFDFSHNCSSFYSIVKAFRGIK